MSHEGLGAPTEGRPTEARGAWLTGWFAVLTGLAWILVIVGALVRAHGAGLACPDWPLCFGELVPTFDASVALEWGHRVFAGSLSLGLLVGTFFVWRRPDLWPRAKGPLFFSFAVFLVQAVLGGLTVLHLLASWTVTSHLLGGNLFAASLLWIALTLGDARRPEPRAAVGPWVLPALVVAGTLLVVQLALGGLTSSQYAGLACTEWPTCRDGVWVPKTEGVVGLHLLHRWNAAVVFLAYAALHAFAFRDRGLRPFTGGLLALVLLQLVLGVMNVLLALPVEVTALHTGTAAALVLLTAATLRTTVKRRSISRSIEGAAVQDALASTGG